MRWFKLLLSRCGTLLVLGGSILFFWWVIIWWFTPEPWLFPDPPTVWARFHDLWSTGVLQAHVGVTATEIFAGYALGLSAGVLCGYPISQITLLEKLLTPYLVAANSIPLVAFAPLLLLWMGNGIGTKIVVAAMIVYFPMVISTISGFHQLSPMQARLMKTLRAKKWQRFIYLELPSALPGLLAGMKIGAPLAVVGAVVGEFLGAGQGLGHLILEANGLLDTPLLFVAIIILAIIGMAFYAATLGLERILIGPWQKKRRHP